MSNYYNQNYPNNPYPSYPGNDNRPPYPIGFDGMGGFPRPPYPPQNQSQYPSNPYPSNPQNYGPPSYQSNNMPFNNQNYASLNMNDGFPIAPSNSPQQQNIYLPNNQPAFKPYSEYNVPAAPVYSPPNQTYPNQHISNPSYQTSNSGSNLYPNLGQANFQIPTQINNYSSPTANIFNPTLRPFQPFNPSHDAEQLYKAMKGFGTDEAKLIDILCKRTYTQRNEISLVYKTSYGKDLVKNIESETSGDFRTLLVTLLTRPMVIEANHLKESVQGFGTDESALIDVICTKTNSEMFELKQTYAQMFRRNLEDDVKDDVSGYFKRFLISLMTAHRSEAPVDYQKAAQLARELYDAGENRLGTNEVVFNRIIANESFAQLRLVFDEYQKISRHPIEQAIRSEMSTSIQRAFLTVIQIIRKPATYYATRIYESMQGVGTKDKLLIRMVVLRSEIDMMDIKMEFQRMYKKSLESFIKSDCSGDYKRGLLCLIGDPNWR